MAGQRRDSRWAGLVSPPTGAWQARLFDPASPTDSAELDQLIIRGEVAFAHDTVRDQFRDYLAARDPAAASTDAELDASVDEALGPRPEEYGRWAWYPWSRRLVRVLPPEEFRALRADRNRYKITPDEQHRLRSRRIGVVGLSVGQSAAVTMAMEGVGGHFRLADFDSLGLSNLNRLLAGVHDLGVNKAALAARRMYELDPYLDIRLYPEGVTDENLAAFFDDGGPLDLLVEECDDLYLKVRLREEARRRRVPVVMETSDRGLLDIERFDVEPDRPLFHGLAGPVRADDLRRLDIKEKLPFVLRILEVRRMSARLRASMIEIGESVEAWPQLGSAVALGGAVVADAARRLLLGELNESGRYSVDLDDLVRDGGARATAGEPAPRAAAPSPQGPLPPRPRVASGPPTVEEVRYAVACGTLAPSGGNAQPWRFHWASGRLAVRLDTSRVANPADYGGRGSLVGIGAAIENIVLAAEELGLRSDLTLRPLPGETDLIGRIEFRRDRTVGPDAAMCAQIPLRCTNRKAGEPHPLAPAETLALARAAAERGAELVLVTGERERVAVGAILGRSDRQRFTTEPFQRALAAELRWSGDEARATGDGLDVDTLELGEVDRAALAIAASWEAMAWLGRFGGGRALERPAVRAVRSACAVGAVVIPDGSDTAYVRGGRAFQRAWLTASALGLAVQPMVPLHLYARPDEPGLDERLRAAFAGLRDDLRAIVPVPAGGAVAVLFRLAKAGPPSARARRRPFEDVFRANP